MVLLNAMAGDGRRAGLPKVRRTEILLGEHAAAVPLRKPQVPTRLHGDRWHAMA